MTGTGYSSPVIKDEPDEFNLNSNHFFNYQQNYGSPVSSSNFRPGNAGSVDPSDLTMNSFNPYSFGSQPAMSASMTMGNSGLHDDELMESLDLNHGTKPGMDHMGQGNMMNQARVHQGNGASQSGFGVQGQQMHQNQAGEMFSNTPDGGPIPSPFIPGNFNYGQFPNNPQTQSLSNHVSPYIRPVNDGSHPQSFAVNRQRPSIQYFDRKVSESRSPLTPKTPALGGLNLGGTPDSGNFGSHPLQVNRSHQRGLSNQWESQPGSLHSYMDSPLASPSNAISANISEMLKGAKSLPAKAEGSSHGPAPGYQSQEAKRRRRRESHNMVERRRRDNINERIQELSHLVPQHRLEDEKVRKHLANNSPMSPSMGPVSSVGMSPPQATSLLAGAGGRRATGAGNITMGIPMEEKDKGPNKGDILNGSVGWTRDLMWALHAKLQQEAELIALINELGGEYPFQPTDDELRMRSELLEAMEKNDPTTFSYTRGTGSGLRVPKHTNLAGEPLDGRPSVSSSAGQMGAVSPRSLSPGLGSGVNSAGHGQRNGSEQQGQLQHGQFSWNDNGFDGGRSGLGDEYGMEMN
ncbi:hypothetical protein MMC25_005139 [Agyrium rufum]|nr:hypothetical protein [Agyrium rufum]